MKTFRRLIVALAITLLGTMPVAAAPVVLGLTNKHPLSEQQPGDLLLSELRCAACHGGRDATRQLERAAPDLSDVGARVSPEHLKRIIASPSAAHTGTTMPDLLTAESPEHRREIAEAITHFLVSQSAHPFHDDAVPEQNPPVGHDLFHSVGCVACHSPRDEQGAETLHEASVNLEHVPAKYNLTSLTTFLYQPLRVRPSGRMPDMKLTPVEAKAIAGYLLGTAHVPARPLKRDVELPAEGKKYFTQFNCAACHKLGDIRATAAGDFKSLDTSRGCLAKSPGKSSKSPWFNLSDAQTAAIRAALAAKAEPISDKATLAMTLTAFNCIACHSRDDYGGVSAERNLLFQTTEKNLGDDGRIPPPLTLLGAKLQSTWLKKVLFDAESVRPYMLTRMPQFGEPNLRHLPELVERLDVMEPVDLSIPNVESGKKEEREREKELRTAGHELLGDKSLYCVACHNFNGKPSPNNKGIDLMTTFQRLKPAWFYRFMLDPAGYRSRIVMPICWPGGKAVQKTVLNGDTDRQIQALWYYLSLGTSAADPSGIRGVETKLQVTDATRTYRGRSSVAGFRGIAVGFPSKMSYAFNAETGTLTAIWRGEFIRVDRSGQGSGGFNPAGKIAALAQDVSFVDLANEQAPWPLRPVMTKEAPVNPDPLYPKNRGYQFKGYYMDDAAIPTFVYHSGEIEIEDRSTADTSGGKAVLRRTIQFNSPKEHPIWFRALTGKIDAESQLQFKTGELRLNLADAKNAKSVLRPAAPDKADKDVSELLLKLDIPQGKSTVSLSYELLQ